MTQRFALMASAALTAALIAGPAAAGIGMPFCAAQAVQDKNIGSNLTVTLARDVAASDSLVAFVATGGGSLPSQSGGVISDTQGGSWTLEGNYVPGGNRMEVWKTTGKAYKAGVDTVTVDYTSGAVSTAKLLVFVGVPGAGAKDKGPTSGCCTATSTAPQITTATLGAPGVDIILSSTQVASSAGDAYTADAGFINLCNNELSGTRAQHIDYKIVSSTNPVTIAPTLGTSRSWILNYWAFMATDPTPTPIPPPVVSKPYCAGQAAQDKNIGSTLAVTLDQDVGASDSLVAFVATGGGSLPSQSGGVISDTQGGTWTLQGNYVPGGNRMEVWKTTGKAYKAGVDTVTVDYTSSAVSTAKLLVFVGMPGAGAKDKGPTSGCCTATSTLPKITTTALGVAGDIIFSSTQVASPAGDAYTAGAGFTNLCNNELPGSRAQHIDYQIASSTSPVTIAPTLGTSRSWIINYWAFLGSGGSPPIPPPVVAGRKQVVGGGVF
jgi:hypothetical protein